MRVIFLDIDGVLNSARYDKIRTENQGNIDETRLHLLAELVEQTDAKIVLTSSWRKHWEKDIRKCDAIGRELTATFAKYGLSIYDKTAACAAQSDRPAEIRAWLSGRDDVDAFVILDDIAFGWGADLQAHLVRTNSMIGFGLEEKHIQAARQVLI